MDRKYKISCMDILGYFLLGISIIMLLKCLMLCFSNDIWYDELFTVGMIEHSYGDLIAFTARDVHPPLYYCVVKFVVDLCKLISAQSNPVVAAKIVSVSPYFILFLYSVTLIRRRFGIFTGGLFLFCAIAMPQLSAYTVEIRMYSLALLLVTAAFLHAYETIMVTQESGTDAAGVGDLEDKSATAMQCVAKKRIGVRHLHGAALVAYGLCAAYTQYFACVAVIMVYLYVLTVFLIRDRGRIKEWLLWVAVSVAGYVPWLFALYRQITAVRENYWILPLTWRSLGGCVKFLMKPAFTNEILNTVLAVVLFVIYIFVILYEIIKLYHHSRDKVRKNEKSISSALFVLAGVWVLAGLVLFGFAASVLLRPVFVYRYMLPAMGCFWLSFAVGLGELWKESSVDSHIVPHNSELCKLKSAYLLLPRIVCPAITGFVLLIGLRDYRAFMGEEEYKVLLMEQTREALSSIAPQDIVLYNFNQVQAVTSYYLDDETDSYLWCGMPETLVQEIVRPYGSIEKAEEISKWCADGRNVWFFGSFNSRDEIVAEWKADGLQAEETGSYLLERYWFNLYKISR